MFVKLSFFVSGNMYLIGVWLGEDQRTKTII